LLLVAAVAAAPAQAADAADPGLSPTTVGGAINPPPNPVDSGQTTPTAQDNTAASNQTTSTTGGNGGSATGGNAGPSQAGDGSGSHGGNAFANGGNAESHSNLENEQSNQISGRHGSGPDYGGSGDRWGGGRGGHDSFVLETTKPRHPARAAAARNHTRFPPPVRFAAASPVTRLEANERRGRETAKASPLSGGPPGHDGRLPGQNPFFSLLSGPGSSGAGLMLLLLAVLASSILLPSQRSEAFRTPTAAWRPLAYVPPIELPG
jgi:hypothetical protein